MTIQPRSNFLLFIVLILLNSCQSNLTEQESSTLTFEDSINDSTQNNQERVYSWFSKMTESTILVQQIPVPAGFHRIQSQSGSFADWLQHLPLKPKGTKVYYYNGEEKYSQEIHESVVDIDIPDTDIQYSENGNIMHQASAIYCVHL